MASSDGYPALYVGQRLTATLLQSMLPKQAWKTTDTSRASTTTTTSDPDLQIPVDADTLWDFEMFLYYTGPVGGGGITALKINLVVPSGATGVFSGDGMASDVAGYANDQHLGFASGANVAFSAPNTLPASLMVKGTVDIGSTAGTVGLSWAQNNSSATATIVKAGSYMKMWRRE
jgi:hypothetical protein